MTPAPLSLYRSIVLAVFPWLAYAGLHRYTVRRVNADGSIDLDPVSSWAKRLLSVSQWTLGGAEIRPAIGSEVVVCFLDNSEARPAIVCFSPLASSAPDKITLNTGADKPIAIGADSGSINLGGTGATALAKANAVSNNLSVLKNAISSAAVVAGDGGAALKANILAALAAWPASMATTKVEGK